MHTASSDYSVPVAGKYEAIFSKLCFGVNVCHGFILHFNSGYFHLMDLEMSIFNFAITCVGITILSFAVSAVTYLLIQHPVGSLYNLCFGQPTGGKRMARQKSDPSTAYGRVLHARELRMTR